MSVIFLYLISGQLKDTFLEKIDLIKKNQNKNYLE